MDSDTTGQRAPEFVSTVLKMLGLDRKWCNYHHTHDGHMWHVEGGGTKNVWADGHGKFYMYYWCPGLKDVDNRVSMDDLYER